MLDQRDAAGSDLIRLITHKHYEIMRKTRIESLFYDKKEQFQQRKSGRSVELRQSNGQDFVHLPPLLD